MGVVDAAWAPASRTLPTHNRRSQTLPTQHVCLLIKPCQYCMGVVDAAWARTRRTLPPQHVRLPFRPLRSCQHCMGVVNTAWAPASRTLPTHNWRLRTLPTQHVRLLIRPCQHCIFVRRPDLANTACVLAVQTLPTLHGRCRH